MDHSYYDLKGPDTVNDDLEAFEKGPDTERSSFYVESLPAPLASPDPLSEISSLCSRNSVRKVQIEKNYISDDKDGFNVTFSSSKIRVRDKLAKLQSRREESIAVGVQKVNSSLSIS